MELPVPPLGAHLWHRALPEGQRQEGRPRARAPAEAGVEGHPSGQPSWIAPGALETGALETESVESGDRQNEG